MNSDLSDIAAGLTQSMSKDGQTTPTANQPMAGFRHTGVGASASRTDYARTDQVIGSVLDYAIDTGTGTAYAIAPSPGITAYAGGQRFVFSATNANSGTAPTLAVNGLTAGVIVNPDGTALGVGDIAAGTQVVVSVSLVSPPTFHLMTPSGAVRKSGAQTITGNKTLSGTTVLSGPTTLSGNTTITGGTNTFTGSVAATSVLANGVTATTQSTGDNSTKVATTAYADRFTPPQRAYAYVTVAAGTATIAKSSGFTSVTRTSAGHFTCTMSSAMPDANYRIALAVGGDPGVGTNASLIFEVTNSARSTTVFHIGTAGDNVAYQDPDSISIEVFA